MSSTLSRNQSAVKKNVEATWGASTIFNPSKYSEVLDPESEISFPFEELMDTYSLKYFSSSMYASVLEDTITQIRILGECNNECRILKTMGDLHHYRAVKYDVEQPAVKDELDGINPKALGKEEYKLDKLDNDRKFLYTSLMATYLDLSIKRTFTALIESIAEVNDREKYRTSLLEEEARNRATRREVAKQLRQQRNHIKSANYDTDISIDEMKTQVEDDALREEIRSRYVTNWQGARTEQHHQTIKDKESLPLVNIEYYKTRTDNEQRVHSELELMNNIHINEKLAMVEKWMNKYDKDMEKIDLKIQIIKNDYTNRLEYRMQLEDKYADHEKQMQDWEHFKDEREKARQYVEKMTNAATTVQAWWRGLLVRMELGPYKPKKRPPPPKGSKKKK